MKSHARAEYTHTPAGRKYSSAKWHGRGSGSRRTNSDYGIWDGGEDVDSVLEDEGEDREDATKEVDGHEHERDADDCRVLVYLVELWSISRPNRRDRYRQTDR